MHTTAPRNASGSAPDEMSLGELLLRVLRFYQRFGRFIGLLALAAALALGALIASRPLYSVTALVEVPDITLEEWRQAQSFLWDQRWVAHSFTASPLLARLALTPVFWNTTVQYRSALRRDDARDLPATEFQKTRGLGLEMALRVRSEAQAGQDLAILTDHIRQALLANSVISLVRDDESALARRPQLHLSLLQIEFDIQQTQARVADMRQLLDHYPELRTMDAHTVVSVTDGGGKYLGPLPQIVALQATISELQANARKVRHDLERLEWTQRLITDIDPTIRAASSGSEIVAKLRDNRDALLAQNPDLPGPGQEASQEMDLKLAQAEARQQAIGIKTRSAISSTPITARNPTWVGLGVFVLVAGVLSLSLGAHSALRRGRPVLPWLRGPLRRWLIVEVQP